MLISIFLLFSIFFQNKQYHKEHHEHPYNVQVTVVHQGRHVTNGNSGLCEMTIINYARQCQIKTHNNHVNINSLPPCIFFHILK